MKRVRFVPYTDDNWCLLNIRICNWECIENCYIIDEIYGQYKFDKQDPHALIAICFLAKERNTCSENGHIKLFKYIHKTSR